MNNDYSSLFYDMILDESYFRSLKDQGCRNVNLFIVASDPGSANAIMPVIIECLKTGHRISGLVSGSAKTMLGQWHEIMEIDDSTSIEDISNILNAAHPDILLAGAGAFNSLEHNVRRVALDQGIPCIAVLDHWMNYWQRFCRINEGHCTYSLPDRICVLDEIVHDEMLAESFAPEKIVVTGQPYFEYIANWKKSLSQDDIGLFRSRFVRDDTTLLIGFCSEPLAEDLKVTLTKNPGYTQYTTIKEIASELGKWSSISGHRIHLVIRPHPRETTHKIENVLMQMNLPSSLSWDVSKVGSSLEFVVSCDLLIGMTSMALIEAFILSQQVLSVQLGLQNKDVFFGTTRGYCPSIYDTQELNKWFEKWFYRNGHSNDVIKKMSGATEHVVSIMQEMVGIKEG